MWVLYEASCLNPLLHVSHLYLISSLCSARWVFRLDACVNRLSQRWHGNGRSPVCVRRWLFKLDEYLNSLWQISHFAFPFALYCCVCCFTACSFAVAVCLLSKPSLSCPRAALNVFIDCSLKVVLSWLDSPPCRSRSKYWPVSISGTGTTNWNT